MLKKIFTSPLIQIVLLTALVLAGMLSSRVPWKTVENAHYDFWVDRYHHPQEQPIAVVAIDERSVRQFGDWPWPRQRIADLVNLLSDSGTAATGICLLYSQPDQSPGLSAIRELRTRLKARQWNGERETTERFDDMLGGAEACLDNDAGLISAIRRGRNMVLPMHVSTVQTSDDAAAEPSGMIVVNSLKSTMLPRFTTGIHWELAGAVGVGLPWPATGSGVLAPFEALAVKAGALGHMNLHEAADGRVRRVPLLMDCQGRLIPAFALQLALKHVGGNVKDISVDHDPTRQPHLLVKSLDLSTDGAYRMLLNYDREWTQQRLFSSAELFNAEIDPAIFKDQIVLIGLTAEPVARSYRVGSDGRASDVEIMANALAGLLNDHRLTRPSWARLMEIGVVFYFATFLALVIPRVTMRIGATILVIFLVTWYAAAVGLLLGYGYKVEVMAPVIYTAAGFLLLQFSLASRRLQADKLDACKTLGLSYQGQGMLDMACDRFMQCPVQDRTVKHLLYNLAMDFERKRMFNKALDIYRHIRKAGTYKDVGKRIQRFSELDHTMVAGGRGEKTFMMAGNSAKPTFGRYEILQEIGRGGMGTVYLGRDPKINREVAIKTLEYAAVEPAELPEVKTRFFREAESAGNLSHPNIVAIHDVGEEHDMAYIAMELLKGDNLTWVCIEDHLLPIPRVLSIIADVAAALDYAHRQGVIHRDIKPANIMMLEDGRVKVTDFSIAHVVDASQTRTGVVLGTPNYMSPEQVAGERLDGRSDLFSLGIVLYELLTGIKPFKGDSMSAVMYAITHSAHRPVAKVAGDVPACVKKLVNKLLAKQKTKRFDSADDASRAIADCLKRMG
jgi:CHASE2 domain-containing sensor protein